MSNPESPQTRPGLIAPDARWPENLPLSGEAIQGAQQHAVLTIQRFIAHHQLPQTYREVFPSLIIPMAAWLIREQRRLGRPLQIAIRGSQGCGKTTLAHALEAVLYRCFAVSSCVLSLDDFYRTQRDRQALGKGLHPLLATRGAPGTHDVELLAQTLTRLHTAEPRDTTRLPVFDKNLDDQAPSSQQRLVLGRPEIIFLEGWCLGAEPAPPEALEAPLNSLESEEDSDGRWRRYVNTQLTGPYRDLYERMDLAICLQAPSWEAVRRWRSQQESKLIRQQGADYQGGLNTSAAFDRFMAHYERITRRQLAESGDNNSVHLQLDEHQRFCELHIKETTASTVE